MAGDPRVERDPAVGHGAHEVDAPARRVGFDSELEIGGAGLEAQPAMHAIEKAIVVDRDRVPAGGIVDRGAHAGAPPSPR